MLGIAAGILGGALVLGVAQTYLQQSGERNSEANPVKPAQLSEPKKGIKPPADGKFEARLWQSTPVKMARNWGKKLK